MSVGNAMRRRLALIVAALTVFAASLAAITQPAGAATATIVSLTFDDGHSSHISTLPMLQSRGMRGTFYVNSGWVGSSDYYMPWPEIHTLAEAGNEIGGHTVRHTNLTTVGLATAQREVCDDRANIAAQGFPTPVSFAYPEAEHNATARQVVAECGYSSARAVGGVSEPGCDECPSAEAVPPADAFALQTPPSVDLRTSLAELQAYVTNAEAKGGGWVVLTFHGICSNSCTGELSYSPANFTAFLDWLKLRESSGTVVRTVGEVMGVASPPPAGAPVTSITCAGTACSSGWYRSTSVNVGLTSFDPDGSAVATTRYTTDGSDPSTSATTVNYTGPFAVTGTTTVRYYSTDVDGHAETVKSQLIQLDAVAPTVTMTSPQPDTSYRRRTSIALAATAGDGTSGSGVARVVFRDGSTTLGTDTTAPYAWTFSSTRTGPRTLTAVATDTAGNTTTSTPVRITITR